MGSHGNHTQKYGKPTMPNGPPRMDFTGFLAVKVGSWKGKLFVGGFFGNPFEKYDRQNG